MSRARATAVKLSDAAPLFTALGDETRLHIVGRLCREGPLSISRLTDGTSISRQAITKHLRVLSDAGLARDKRHGRERIWQIEARRLAEVRQNLTAISAQWDEALGRLQTLVEKEEPMPVQLNHTIMWVHDQKASANFLTSILGLPEATRFGPFLVVNLDNDVSLDLYEKDASDKISLQHYAFLITEAEFDEIFGRIRERNLEYWADPARTQPGEINTHFGGRGVYFKDPNGHLLEIITRPYGSSGD